MPKPGSVTVVVVNHAGMSWLPQVLDGVAAQTRRPDRSFATDTGSRDGSFELLTAELGADRVCRAGRRTSYGEAVDLALELDAGLHPDDPTEWVWLLHDDSNPAPEALAALLAASEADPGADLLGPKLREWPSLRRLQEVGVTISATGRRETGLERGEYDQGQHDEVREVLAVNTAGLLIRRRVYDTLGGIDRALPVFGNDIDLGWRAAKAGHRTVVVPEAVVFHVEAAHRGVRRTSLTGNRTLYQERRAALFTLLANARGARLWWLLPRLVIGTLLRTVGYLLLRSVGEALDELAALLTIGARPGQVISARRARRDQAGGPTGDPDRVKALLAPWWTPYRHGLDYVADVFAALGSQAQDVAERRRAVAVEESGLRQAPREGTSAGLGEEDDAYVPESGWLVRFVTSPVALGITAAVVVVLAASWPAWGSLAGGGLAPAPEAAGAWWRLWLERQHALGLGSDVSAPPYVAALAVPSALLGAAATTSLVLVAAMPLALWGAYRLLRTLGKLSDPLGTPRWLLATGATTYAVLPAVSGAWGAGRLGPVVITALLPWWVHAVLGFADPDRDRRWRAAFRSGLLLAVITAFGPSLFVAAALVTLLVLLVGVLLNRALVRDRSVSLPPLVALLVPVVLWLPWWLPLIRGGDARALLLEPGRLPPLALDGWDLLLGRVAGGAPWWWALPVLGAAIAALLADRSRPTAIAAWAVVLVTGVAALLAQLPSLQLADLRARPSIAALVPLAQAALVIAAVAFGDAAVRSQWPPAPATRRALGLVLGLVALAAPVSGLVWFAGEVDPAIRDGDRGDDIPAYMTQSSAEGVEHGVLILRGSVEEGLRFLVRRGDGVTVGEDEIVALTAPSADFDAAVRGLTSRPSPEDVAALSTAGIEYVVMPSPADGRVSATLDAASGLTQASAEDRSTRAWQVEAQATDTDGYPRAERSTPRTLLIAGQVAVLAVLLVLCGPSRRREEAS